MASDPDDVLSALSQLIAERGLGSQEKPKDEEAKAPASGDGAADEPFEVRLERCEREVNGLPPRADPPARSA